MINLRPMQPEDIQQLYGEPLKITVRGITAEEDGRVLGIGAIYCHDGCSVLICCINHRIRPLSIKHAKAMLKGARQLLAMAFETRMPVRVVADRRETRAVALIKHLGAKHIEKDIYEWPTPA